MTENIFIVRSGERPIEDWLERNFVAVGWSRATGIDNQTDRVQFKEQLRSAYADHKWTERALGNMTGSFYNFIHEIQPGDLVVVPAPNSFYVAEVKSPPFYDQTAVNTDSAWKRHVKWLRENPLPRIFATNTLQRRLKVQQTCVKITDLKNEVTEALQRNEPIDFADTVLEKAAPTIADALRMAINDRGLEDLVAKLIKASGARAQPGLRHDQRQGDTDVTAIYDLKVGNQPTLINVCYQIKHHEDTTNEDGIRQIIDRMKVDTSIDRGCFVTTAEQVTQEAQQLADENEILIVRQQELVEWILMTGLNALTAEDTSQSRE